MSREIDLTTSDGLTLYAVIHRKRDGQYWTGTGTAFEARNNAHWATPGYCVALNKDVISAGVQANYSADFPALPADAYAVEIYTQAGGSPAPSDGVPRWEGSIEWDGTAEIRLARATAQTDKLQFDGSGFVKSSAQSLPSPAPSGYGATVTNDQISVDSESVRVG